MWQVAWRTAAACFKGDQHTIANNTIFDSSDDDVTAALFVMMYDPAFSWSKKGENEHTRLSANAADTIFNVSGKLPGIHADNLGGVGIRTMLTDPDHLDFRPKAGSPLDTVGAGAYTRRTEDYWTPGSRAHPPVVPPRVRHWRVMVGASLPAAPRR